MRGEKATVSFLTRSVSLQVSKDLLEVASPSEVRKVSDLPETHLNAAHQTVKPRSPIILRAHQGVATVTTGLRRTEAPSRLVRTRTRGLLAGVKLDA